MAVKKISRSHTDSVRVRALTAEGYSCNDCTYLLNVWKQGRSRTEKSCEERGYGSMLCQDFSSKLAHAGCGHCVYLHTPDPVDKVACGPEHGRTEDSLTCSSFKSKASDLETDDLLLVHAGRVVEGVKYADTPRTPVSIRIGDLGLIIEPVVRKNGVSFVVIPYALDDQGNMILEPNSDAAVARSTGNILVAKDLFRDSKIRVTPKIPSYKKRLRQADTSEVPPSVKRILRASVVKECEDAIPSGVKDQFFWLLNESVPVSMAASWAIRMHSKKNDVEPSEAEDWKATLVKLRGKHV